MTNSSQSAVVTPATCPAGCIAPHNDDKTVHYFPEIEFRDIYGKPVRISAFVNGTTGRAGVYIGDYELHAEDASAFGTAVTAAAYDGCIALLSRSA